MFIAGPIATGDNFIGREKELQYLKNFFSGSNNYSLTGLSRVGKSSLIKELLIRESESITSGNIEVVEFSLTPSTREKVVFSRLFQRMLDVANNLHNNQLIDEAKIILSELENDSIDAERVIELSKLMFDQKGIRFLLIFDEFDYAPDVFHKYLMTLRQLISASKSINALTVSRTSLVKLFPLVGGGSVFQGVFIHYPLKGFATADVDRFRDKLNVKSDDRVNDNVWGRIRYFSGTSPFCLAFWCNAYLNVVKEHGNELDVNSVIEEIEETCIPQTDDFLFYQCEALKRLGELGNLKTFIKAITSGEKNLDKNGFRSLNSYGVISWTDKTLTQPYLKDFLFKKPDANIDLSELRDLAPIIDSLIQDCDSKLVALFGRGQAASRISTTVTCHRRDLQAIKIKMNYELELSELNAFLLSDLTDEEINLWKQKIGECRAFLDNV